MATSPEPETSTTEVLSPIVAPDPDANPSQPSQTASDYISTQLRLEADAREVLPYSFDRCTQPLGPLRQNLFACLTCNPPPSPSSPSSTENFIPAAICYSCSISCHGEHTLVELFARRNFVCDCGTTRIPATCPCTLRINPATGLKEPVHSEVPAKSNAYNQNVRNRFCGCGEWYDAAEEKGTMFQCLGLAGEEAGGCGEDWWHPECVIWGGEEGARVRREDKAKKGNTGGREVKVVDDGEEEVKTDGFPQEDDFDAFICHKCVNAVPWIKQYAGTEGFLPASFLRDAAATTNGPAAKDHLEGTTMASEPAKSPSTNSIPFEATNGEINPQHALLGDKKRTADDADLDDTASTASKRAKPDSTIPAAYHTTLPSPPSPPLSLFCKSDFREQFCRCKECYPLLSAYPQLLEEEENYSPPLSEDGEGGGNDTGGSVGSKSLLERGEAALSNVDRVRAIGMSVPQFCSLALPHGMCI